MIDWLFTNALAALALAAIAGTLIWTFRPAPAVRHALWLVVVLKLVSPTGLVVSVPLPVEPPIPAEKDLVASHTAVDEAAVVEEAPVFTFLVEPGDSEEAAAVALKVDRDPTAAPEGRPAPAMQTAAPPAVAPPGEPFDYRPYLLGVWAAGALVVGWRQVRETVRFARFTARALPAGDLLVAEVAVVANRLGVRVPTVRVLTGLTSPLLWCLGRPVLLWPAGLECRLKGDGRRAVIAHELAHLRRRDHWVRRLEMAAAVLHWWNPLFWLVRKNLRADAELACDAWATGHADRRAYAEALLEVCSFNPRRRPAPAVGVIGEGRRAMQERLTMIMRDRVPCRLAFGAKLVVALMAIAAVPAWTFGQADEAAQADDKQMEELQAQLQALAEKLEALKASKQAEGQKAKAVKALKEAPDKAEKLKAQKSGADDAKAEVERAKALYEKARTAAPKVVTAGEGGYKVIGPDGKEVKGAKVIIGGAGAATGVKPGEGGAKPLVVETPDGEGKKVRIITAQGAHAANLGNYYWSKQGSGQSVVLSRATYKLNKDQADALGKLLGSVKASVMETKVDGESITVTTTPDVQAAIGQIVRLVQGQTGASTYQFKFNTTPGVPGVPGTPGQPGQPARPAKPGQPGQPEQPTKPEKPGTPSLFVPGTFEVDKDAIKQRIEVELKQLDKLKDLENLKNLNIDVKGLEELKNLKIDLSKVKDLEKLKDLEKAEALKTLERRRADVNKARGDAEREREQVEKRQAELEKAIKALIGEKKPGSEKKPEGPAK